MARIIKPSKRKRSHTLKARALADLDQMKKRLPRCPRCGHAFHHNECQHRGRIPGPGGRLFGATTAITFNDCTCASSKGAPV